jgi:hypothetical protein
MASFDPPETDLSYPYISIDVGLTVYYELL